MKQKNLFVLCGTPGCGKSTWVKNRVEENGGVWVSRDVIRFGMLKEGEDYFAHENEVYDKFVQTIQEELDKGGDVYADATHLNEKGRIKLLDCLNLEDVKLTAVRFDVPLEVCLERNEMREGRARVPKSVVRRMWHSRTDPAFDYKYKFDEIIAVTD